jgi:hypothetical protein
VTNEELARIINGVAWKQARSSDHQYVLQSWEPALTLVFQRLVRDQGRVGWWRRYRNTYVLFAGYRYFLCAIQNGTQFTLNRARHFVGDIRWDDGMEPTDLYPEGVEDAIAVGDKIRRDWKPSRCWPAKVTR